MNGIISLFVCVISGMSVSLLLGILVAQSHYNGTSNDPWCFAKGSDENFLVMFKRQGNLGMLSRMQLFNLEHSQGSETNNVFNLMKRWHGIFNDHVLSESWIYDVSERQFLWCHAQKT